MNLHIFYFKISLI